MSTQKSSITQTFQTLAPGDKPPSGGALLMLRPNSDNTTLKRYARLFDTVESLCAFLREEAAPEGFHYHIEDIDFTGQDLTGARLNKAQLSNCDFSDARMTFAQMSGAHLNESRMCGTDLRHAQMRLSWLDGIDFSKAVMNHSDMTSSVCTSANFSDAQMRRVKLSGSCAQTAVFTGADLRGALIQDVHLELTQCINADMRGTNVDGSYVSRADLSGVRITRQQMEGTKGTPIAQPGIRTKQLSTLRRKRRQNAP